VSRARRTAGLVRAALAAACVAVLAGCLSLPTSGPVADGVDVAPPETGLELFAPGPALDATPEEIVRGFLLAAGSGVGDDFARAREFLTTTGSQAWDPSGGATLYADADALRLTVGEIDDFGVAVSLGVEVAATLDDRGVYAQATPGSTQELGFELVQSADEQWRIASLDPGVVMSLVTFGQQYREASVYFLATDGTNRLVPDARWVPRSGSENAIVRALLAGPVEWLQPGVVSAFPDGTRLGLDGVALDQRVATVTLSTAVLDANASLRALALAQLQATLGQLQQVGRVEVSVDGTPLAVDPALATIAATPQPDRRVTVLSPEGLATVSGDRLALVEDAVPLPAGLTALALPYGEGPLVALRDGSTLVALDGPDGDVVDLLAPGGPLLDPSYDVHGWVWSGTTGVAGESGPLVVVDPGSGAALEVAAPDLDGAEVLAVRVSREGARLAYALRSGDDVTVYVAAVVRDADGVPVEISTGTPTGVPYEDVDDLVWVDETQLGVLASAEADGASTVRLIGVGGQSVTLPSVDGATTIAAGDGSREVVLVTAAGQLFGRSGTGWRQVLDDVASPAYAG
jgi:hypothetical protein